MNIFEAIREDHEKQRTLSKILAKTEGDSDGRAELFKRLKRELETHAIAEERNFYKPLMESDKTIEHARHGIAEHHEMDELVAELEKTDHSSPHWKSTVEKLYDKIIHHLDDEEHIFFQLAGKVFSEKQKVELAKSYQKEMNEQK